MRNPPPPSPSSSSSTTSKKTTPCCSSSKVGIKKGPWTPEEDELLSSCIKREGEGRWRTLPKRAGLLRCGKSCRLRWMNYLRPSIKRGCITPDEEDLILRLHRLLGNRWSLIAGRIPGRTDNEIKNYWNTKLSRKLISQGIDPRTHKPLNPAVLPPASSSNTNNNNINDHHHPHPASTSSTPNPSISPPGYSLETEDHTHGSEPEPNNYQNQVVDINNNNNGGGGDDILNWSNYIVEEGFVMGFSPASRHGEVGNIQEDTVSWFLDSLIDDSMFVNQQQGP